VDGLNEIVQRLEPSLGPLTGEPTELGGGITNRNFRVTLGEGEYVIRRPGKDTALLGIDRGAERLATETAARLGIAPEVAASDADSLVTRYVVCRDAQAGELERRAEEVAVALRRFHDEPLVLPASFWVPELLERYALVVRERGGTLPTIYSEVVAIARRIEQALTPTRRRPCHNDLLPGNIIIARGGERILIVDWEYAGMGDPRFDLGNLSVNNGFDAAAEDRLLAAYHGSAPTDGVRASLKLMRVMSDAREAAWGVVQGTVSELDFDFDGYGSEHFQRLQDAVEQPLFEEWLALATHDIGSSRGQSA
jgi:thiamine kinase-like enzyme